MIDAAKMTEILSETKMLKALTSQQSAASQTPSRACRIHWSCAKVEDLSGEGAGT